MIPGERRARWTAALLLAICFLGGAIVGVFADRLVLLRQDRMLPKGGLRVASTRIVERLDRELKLTPQQRERIAAIVGERDARVQKVWSNVRPAVRAELAKADAEIEKELTAEQRERYRELRDRWRRRANRLLGVD